MAEGQTRLGRFTQFWFQEGRLLRRIFAVIVMLMVIVVGFVAVKLLIGASQNAARVEQVLNAVHASYPDFCQDGHILAEASTGADTISRPDGLFPGRYWSIKCDSWSPEYFGNATIVDMVECTTITPTTSTLGSRYNEMQKLNSHNGEKMPVCP